MPYKIDTEKKIIPKKYDRRVRFTEGKKKECVKLYNLGVSLHQISDILGVSRRALQFFLFPERLETCKLRREERGGSKIYYDKEMHVKAVRETRQYRKLLNEQGLLLTNEQKCDI